MSDRLQALRLFARVARAGGFSRAARDLGLSQPSASRVIARLEQELGAALVRRTTRSVMLTDAGADYLARIEPILAALDEADHAARGGDELRGTLRVGVSTSLSVREVIPRLPPFLAGHPRLRVDLAVSDARQDLVAEGVDVALRFGALADSSMVARKLAEAPRVVIASPAYLADAPPLRTPGDLALHQVVLGPGFAPPVTWSFGQAGKRVAVRVDGRLSADANEAITAAAVAGLGPAITSLWGCRAELSRGDLVRVLADWELPPVELHALFPAAGPPRPAARAFAEHLRDGLRQSVS
jgi:DNA-binding transcriptional LysR family regulator